MVREEYIESFAAGIEVMDRGITEHRQKEEVRQRDNMELRSNRRHASKAMRDSLARQAKAKETKAEMAQDYVYMVRDEFLAAGAASIEEGGPDSPPGLTPVPLRLQPKRKSRVLQPAR